MGIPCQQLVKVLGALCAESSSPFSLKVARLVKEEQWLELQKLKVNPFDYNDSESLFRDNLVVDFLRKADIDTSVDKKGVAISTFFSCEAINKKTNDRISRFLPGTLLLEDQVDNAMFEFIEHVRKDLEYVLGRLPDDLVPSFGNGSTFADKGQLITIPDKMSSRPTLTIGSFPVVAPLFVGTAWDRSLSGSLSSECDFVKGNRFSSVPKDASKHRGIGIEPSLNVSYQLAVGKILKTKLRKIGIDLKEGQKKHRQLAANASIFGTLATIDLSNASDTLARHVVKLLLPEEWYELLDSLRSPFTFVNGKWHRLEKFSSMGNGFTFELESLIFACLSRACVYFGSGSIKDISVYGDDILCPVEDSPAIISCLKFFGFTTNSSKTFNTGSFRESCGGDFFQGMPVRAHFIKELPYEPQHWISLANGIRRMAFTDIRCAHRWSYLRRAWYLCLDALPRNIRRLTGPEHLGDVVIHSDVYESTTRKFRDGSDVTLVRGYVPIPITLNWNNWKPAVQLAAALKALPSSGVTPRGGISGHKVKFIPLYGLNCGLL